MNESPVTVDPSVLESLTGRLGDRGVEFRTSLVQTWRDETTARLADLNAAAASGNADDVARAAHTLKSSSAALGALPLSILCEDVEHGIRGGEDRDLPADAAAITAAVSAAADAFTALWG